MLIIVTLLCFCAACEASSANSSGVCPEGNAECRCHVTGAGSDAVNGCYSIHPTTEFPDWYTSLWHWQQLIDGRSWFQNNRCFIYWNNGFWNISRESNDFYYVNDSGSRPP